MAKKVTEDSKFIRLERKQAEEIAAFLFAIGNQFIGVKNAEGAFDCFKYCLDLNPKCHPAVFNLGTLYNVMGNLEGSYRMLKEACRMAPDDSMTHTALAEVCRKMGNLREAREILERVIKVDDDNFIVMAAIAILCYDEGRLAEAREWNERAMEKKPGDIHMMLNSALIHMTYGEWATQWTHYEYCLSYQKNEKMSHLSQSNSWHGQECEGKTLIVISDQGSGDAIQFARYLAEAKALGKFGKLVYLVQPDIKELAARVDGVDEVIGFGERMQAPHDEFSALLGIMRVLKISPDNALRPPHIKTDPKLDELWSSRVNRFYDGTSKKVGIVWAGDPKHGNDHARSISLTQFLKILYGANSKVESPKNGKDQEAVMLESYIPPIPNVQLFSFQVGPGLRQLTMAPVDDEFEIVELGTEFRTFDDTASALRQMDLLISCDTSVAHLAGSMGIPCWVLVPNPPEWRWLLDRDDSPWYESVRIFRQRTPKDWDSVFINVLEALREFATKEQSTSAN